MALLNQAVRSEEHTSELQSPVPISYAVFCLKKKKKNKIRQMSESNKERKRRKNRNKVGYMVYPPTKYVQRMIVGYFVSGRWTHISGLAFRLICQWSIGVFLFYSDFENSCMVSTKELVSQQNLPKTLIKTIMSMVDFGQTINYLIL